MPLFGPARVEAGTKCTKCYKGTYSKVKEHYERDSLGKAMFKGFMTGATKKSASEIGLGKATYRCSACGHEVTN